MPLPASLGKEHGFQEINEEKKKKGRSYVTSGCELAGVQESCCTQARKLGQRRARGRMCPQLPLMDVRRRAEEKITKDT